MGFDETDFVYKITVDGTDIQEYYDLEKRLPESQVKDMWLSDATEKHGGYLPSVFSGRVNVELLTDSEEGEKTPELGEEAIPLPPVPDEDKE